MIFPGAPAFFLLTGVQLLPPPVFSSGRDPL